MHGQETFNPVDFCFTWTADGWYTWSYENGHAEAKRERDLRYKELKARGLNPRRRSQAGCLISRGGIGSGRPHVEFVVTVYRLDY